MRLFRLPAGKPSNALVRTLALWSFVVGLSTAVTARAAEQVTAHNSSSWGLGLGLGSSQKPYTDIDHETDAIPLIYFENDYLRVFGPTAELKLPSLRISDSHRLNFNIVGKYDSSGYDEGDSRILDGMDDRDGGFWAGAKVEWENDLVSLHAEWLADATGDSNGQRFTLGFEKTWVIDDRILLSPRLSAIWQDKEYVDYYFGVRSEEARFDRPTYEGKAGVNTEFGVRGTYMFDNKHSVFLDFETVRLASEIKDSPLVDSSTENSVRLGYLYRF